MLDKAWNSMNSNQFGTNEFMAWCKAVGTEPLMGLNLGTGTPRGGRRAGRVLQRRQGHEVERSAPQARLCRALQREALVPGQ